MKRIIICSDGTWNDRGDRATNVSRMAQLVTPSGRGPDGAPTAQVVYYDPGVGTERGWTSKLTGGAFGEGLSANVLDAYRFVVDNYDEGDELWLFGFSRGAFTVRSLSGLIRKCGVLRKAHAPLARRAYDIYRARSATPSVKDSPNGVDGEPAASFRAAHSIVPIPIHFIGVWDTVGALGIPVGPRNPLFYVTNDRWRFHDVDLSTRVRFAYQALAIDERRSAFAPAVWNVQPLPPGVTQVVEQRWFPGVHSDVGGGYFESGLADTALRWMVEKAVSAGLSVDVAYDEKDSGIPVCADALGPIHNSTTGLFRIVGLFSSLERPIRPDAEQVLSHAAQQRMASNVTPAYEPANVRRYLAERGALAVAGNGLAALPTQDYV